MFKKLFRQESPRHADSIEFDEKFKKEVGQEALDFIEEAKQSVNDEHTETYFEKGDYKITQGLNKFKLLLSKKVK